MPLTANFLADFSSFIKAASDATTTTEELVEAAGKVGRSMDEGLAQAAQNIRGFGTSLVDFGKNAWSVLNSQELKSFGSDVKSFMTGYIEEFAEAEAGTTRLAAALRSAGEDVPKVSAQYAEMAKQLQNVSTYSAGAVTQAQALLTTVGQIKPDQMQATLQATMDLAAGLGIELPRAADLMARAAATNGKELGRLRTVLGENIEKGTGFEGVMAAVNKQFGGQSLAALQTTAGEMEHLKNQMSDINEQIGKVFAENLKVLFDMFQSLPEGVQTFIIAVAGIGTAIAPVLVSLSSLVTLAGSAGVSIAGIGAAWEAILPWLGPAGWIALALIGLFSVWKYWDVIKETFWDTYNFLKKTFTDLYNIMWDLDAKLRTIMQSIYTSIKTWLVDKLTAVWQWVKDQIASVVATFQWMYQSVVGGSSVPDLVDGIGAEFRRLDRVMVDQAWAAAQEANRAFDDVTGPTVGVTAAGGGLGLAGALGAGGVNVTVNMTGMLGTDDPQTRSVIKDLVSDALMQGMRGSRLLGTT